MTLQELQQAKKDVESGVVLSKKTWLAVLDTAIEASKFKKGEVYSFPENHTLKAIPPEGITILGIDEHGDFICKRIGQ